MTYDAVVARKGQLQAVTGLPEAAFAHLHTVFAAVVEHARRHYTLQGTVRQRALRGLPRDSAFAATTRPGNHGLNLLLSSESYRISDMQRLLNGQPAVKPPLQVYASDLAEERLGVTMQPVAAVLQSIYS